MSDAADEAQQREERHRAESLTRAGIRTRHIAIPNPHYEDAPSPQGATKEGPTE